MEQVTEFVLGMWQIVFLFALTATLIMLPGGMYLLFMAYTRRWDRHTKWVSLVISALWAVALTVIALYWVGTPK